MVSTPAVRNLIREGKTHQLPSILQTNARAGMVTMEASLKKLLADRIISDETYRLFSVESGILRILE
jgi:twitching motility protein PilT